MQRIGVTIILKSITELPKDKKIAGVHCVPITENGSLVMAWDKEEHLLTTIGGRLEGDESIEEALAREAMEEVGLIIGPERIPFASWYWESTNSYTVWFLVKVHELLPYSFDFEKSGHVIFNFETAQHMIAKLEPDVTKRRDLLVLAEQKVKELALQNTWKPNATFSMRESEVIETVEEENQ